MCLQWTMKMCEKRLTTFSLDPRQLHAAHSARGLFFSSSFLHPSCERYARQPRLQRQHRRKRRRFGMKEKMFIWQINFITLFFGVDSHYFRSCQTAHRTGAKNATRFILILVRIGRMNIRDNRKRTKRKWSKKREKKVDPVRA